ncbi:MAG: type II toxin-antitoxin system HigB family toxin [Bacteroidales bacterium]|nr:type II toxin-antitoxin system HigB family toxin [Bacteroidales bacterium]
MRVIAKSTLKVFWMQHKDCEQSLRSWYNEANVAEWKSPADIKRWYPSASIIPENRVVFNINGNKYRLIVKINYDFGIIWIRFIGTHSEYDKIKAQTI